MINPQDVQFQVQNKQWYDGIELYARVKVSPGYAAYIQPAIFETINLEENRGLAPLPFLALSQIGAQSLIDGLWACGLRPSDGTGSAGQLKATENHLEDMRTLTFKLIDRKEK